MGSIQGFDEAIDRKPADEVIKLLNQLYTVCDDVIAETEVVKIETNRDIYLVTPCTLYNIVVRLGRLHSNLTI